MENVEDLLNKEIPRADLVDGAKVLKQWADLLGYIVLSKESIAKLLEIVSFELKFQEEFREKYGLDIYLHSYIHSRFEYMSKIISFFLHCCPEHLTSFVSKILVFFFKVYKVLLPLLGSESLAIEDDLYSLSSTVGFNHVVIMDVAEKGSLSWYQMCFSSTSLLLHAILIKFPQKVSVLRLSLSEAMSLTKSKLWQVQLIALSVVRSLLHVDLYQLQIFQREKFIRTTEQELKTLSIGGKSKKTLTNKPSAGKLASSSSQTRLESKSASNINRVASQIMRSESTLGQTTNGSEDGMHLRQQAEEICRIGFLRTLVWLLFHRHYRIRLLAAQVLQIQSSLCRDPILADGYLQPLNSVKGNSKPPECQSGMWSAVIEQGIIPLLETCAAGFVVFRSAEVLPNKPKFPEVPIRNVARLLLDDVMHHTEYFLNVRHRLLTALSYSGNLKLRLNVLCSILCLCGQSPILGCYLWEHTELPAVSVHSKEAILASGAASLSFPIGGQVFAALLYSLTTDPSGAKQILDLIIQIFQMGAALFAANKWANELAKRHPSNEIATQAGGSNKSILDGMVQEVAQKLRDSLPPTVLVTQEASVLQHQPGSLHNVSTKTNRSNFVAEGVRQVKMTIPKLPVIHAFCEKLSRDIEKYHILQIDEAANFYLQMHSESGLPDYHVSAAKEDLKQIEQSLKLTISNFSPQYFLSLHSGASYEVWQELFSHMCANSLREKMLNKLNISQLCSCLALAYQHDMQPLIDSYVKSLCARISSATILPILRAAVLELQPLITADSNANTLKKQVQVSLSLACLEFLRSEWDFCIRRKDSAELKEILQCLCTIFGTLLFS